MSLRLALFLPRWLRARSCSVALSSLELFPPVAEPHVEWNNKFKAAVNFQIFDVPTYNFKKKKKGLGVNGERKREGKQVQLR